MENDIIVKYLSFQQLKGKKQDTLDEYYRALNEYAQYLNTQNVFSFFAASKEVIMNYYILLINKKCSWSIRYKKSRRVHLFYQWLQDTGKILCNPCPGYIKGKRDARPRTIPSQKTIYEMYIQLKTVKEIWEVRNGVMVDLAYSCGLRRCELQRLNLTDISSDDGTLRIKGKRDNERFVPIGRKTIHHVMFYIYHIRPRFFNGGSTKALFVSWKQGGKRLCIQTINRALKEFVKTHNLDKSITPHALRLAYATDLLKNGAPIQDVSKMLGHTKLETTQIYTRLVPTDLKKHHQKYHPRS